MAAWSQRFEAEAADYNTNSIRSNYSPSAGQYVDIGGENFIEWTVDVPTGGTYAVNIAYAMGGSSPRPLGLEVDGAAALNLPFAPTSTWADWQDQHVELTLEAGSHTLRLVTQCSSGPNIDYLDVELTASVQSMMLANALSSFDSGSNDDVFTGQLNESPDTTLVAVV